MACSKHSHKFVDKSETIRSRHHNNRKQQTRKMRNDKFYENELNALMNDCIQDYTLQIKHA